MVIKGLWRNKVSGILYTVVKTVTNAATEQYMVLYHSPHGEELVQDVTSFLQRFELIREEP